MRWVCGILAVFATLLASAAAPVPKHLMPREENWWPTELGTKWVYDVHGVERVHEIVKVENRPASKVITMQVRMTTRQEPWELTYEVFANSVIYRLLTDIPVDELLLRWPVEAGDAWDVKHPIRQGFVAQTGRATVGRPEELKVPAGTFQATKVTVKVTEIDGQPIDAPRWNVFWYVRGIGPVKVHYDLVGGQPQELKSFTRGRK